MLLTSADDKGNTGSGERQPRYRPHLHFACGALQPNASHGDSPLYPVNERLQQEDGEPQGRDCVTSGLLQLLPDSPEFARHSCYGSRDH